MGDRTRIEWADATWSPVTGCTKISEACRHCYIDRCPPLRIAGRAFVGARVIGSSTDVQLHPERLDRPSRWRRGRRIFVCSMSDLFHEQVPDRYIAQIWAVMACASQHQFLVLSKRHARMHHLLNSPRFVEQVAAARDLDPQAGDLSWPVPWVWLGATVEDQRWAGIRIPALLDTPAATRWVSCEPLLARLDLTDYLGRPGGLDWVVAGGESGSSARPSSPGWFRGLRDQAIGSGTPWLFKQWGEWGPAPIGSIEEVPAGQTMVVEGHPMIRWGRRRAGRSLDGRCWDQYPSVGDGR